MADLTFDCIGAQAERYAVMPTITLSAADQRDQRAADRRDRAALPDPDRAVTAALHGRRGRAAARPLRRHGALGRHAEAACSSRTSSTMVTSFTGSTEVDSRSTSATTWRSATTGTSPSLESGEIPLLLLFSGTVFSIVDGRLQVQQVPWQQGSGLPAPGERLAGSDRRALPEQRVDHDEQADARRAAALQDPRALPTWDATVTALLAEAADATGADERRRRERDAADARGADAMSSSAPPRARPRRGGRDPLRGLPAVPLPRVRRGRTRPGSSSAC